MSTSNTRTTPRRRTSPAAARPGERRPQQLRRPTRRPAAAPDVSAEELLTELAGLPADAPEAEAIRARLVQMYAPLARREARRYRNRGEMLDDLEQVAMLGLMKAIAGFDPGFGKPFISYLLPMVTGELKRHFRDRTWAVRVPRKHQEKRSELNRFTSEFSQRKGRAPTTAEIAEALELDVEETVELLDAASAYSALSLDAPRGSEEEDDASLGDSLGSIDSDLEHVVDREALKAALANLPAQRRRILLLRFFGNKTQAEIAQVIGVSQMHISRLLKQTLADLRAEMAGGA
jgi:RNA polymerase sigma-B factor